jgi:hypothetical protein
MIYTNSLEINTVDIKRITKNGKQWLVAPVVAAIESVMNGRLVQRDELAESVESLNGRPITINHPSGDQGQAIPANNPDVETIGKVFNAHIDEDSLKAEAWFEVERLNQTGTQGLEILNAIKGKKVLEVSLGWFSDKVTQAGNFLGNAYTEIVHNIRHDHLAILLDTPGACSVDDGCGLVRNEEEAQENKVVALVKRVLVDLGFSQDKENIPMADKEPKQEPVVIDNSAQIDELKGLIKDLVTSIETVNGRVDEVITNSANSEKAPIVARLVANERCTLEADSLQAMSVADLSKLEAAFKPANYAGNGGSFSAFISTDENVKYVEVD